MNLQELRRFLRDADETEAGGLAMQYVPGTRITIHIVDCDSKQELDTRLSNRVDKSTSTKQRMTRELAVRCIAPQIGDVLVGYTDYDEYRFYRKCRPEEVSVVVKELIKEVSSATMEPELRLGLYIDKLRELVRNKVFFVRDFYARSDWFDIHLKRERSRRGRRIGHIVLVQPNSGTFSFCVANGGKRIDRRLSRQGSSLKEAAELLLWAMKLPPDTGDGERNGT